MEPTISSVVSDQASIYSVAVRPVVRRAFAARHPYISVEPPSAAFHAGAIVPPRSTLADANRVRDSAVFSGLFMHMLSMTTRGLRRKMGDAVRLIYSTGLHLAGVGSEWARFSTKVCGAKAHVIYDPDLGCPIYHIVTEAKSTTSSPPRRCRSRRGRPTSTIWVIMTTLGGLGSTRPTVVSCAL